MEDKQPESAPPEDEIVTESDLLAMIASSVEQQQQQEEAGQDKSVNNEETIEEQRIGDDDFVDEVESVEEGDQSIEEVESLPDEEIQEEPVVEEPQDQDMTSPQEQPIEGQINTIQDAPEADDPSSRMASPEVEEPQSVEPTPAPEPSDAQNEDVNETIEIDSAPEKAFEVAKDTPQPSEPVEPHQTRPKPQQVSQSKTAEDGKVDPESISSFLEINVASISSLDYSLLQKLQSKVKEFADLRSEKTILEVNLEQSTHATGKKIDLFKKQLQTLRSENKELKEQNHQLETSSHNSTKRLNELELQMNSKSSEFEQSQAKIDSILSEERKTFELMEKKNKDIENLKKDYNDIQECNTALRKELISLETSNQTLSFTSNQSKLKIQSLENQLELVQKNHEWIDNEFKSISAEYTNYRKDKSAEVSSLQSQLELTSTELNSFKSRYESLKVRFEDVSKNLDDSLTQIKSLTDEKSSHQEEFIKEMSVKDRLVELLKKSNEDLKGKFQYLETTLEKSNSGVANENAQLRIQAEEYRSKLEQSEAKITQLEETLEELTQVTNQSPSGANDSLYGIPKLSPLAKSMASEYEGVSLSQLYADFTLVKRQLVQERRAKERIQHQIDLFVNELEQKAPIINATKERAAVLENELANLSIILEDCSKEKDSLEKSNAALRGTIADYEVTVKTLNKQKVDLARQIQTLLIKISIRGDSNGPLTPSEKQAVQRIANGEQIIHESDTDKLISERLVTFQSIVDLQSKNEELLKITRELGAKLEKEEKTSRSRLENLESSAIDEAKEAILTLQEEISSINVKLNSVTRERDMFRSMLANKGSSNNILTGDLSSDSVINKEYVELQKKYDAAQSQLAETQKNLQEVKVEAETSISLLNKEIASLSNERSQLSINLSREKSTATLVEERYKSLQENLKFVKSEADELRERSQKLQESLTKQDLKTQQVANELIQSQSLIESLRAESSNLKAEKQLWTSVEKRLSQENSELAVEKVRLNGLLSNLQVLEKEREQNSIAAQNRLIKQSESLEAELNRLREQLTGSQGELKELYNKRDTDSKAYQHRVDILSDEISSMRQEITQKQNTIDALNKKVDLLKSKLNTTDSKVQEYERLSSLTNNSPGSSEASSNNALILESINLKKQLEETKSELEEAYKNTEEFRKIAQSSEDALKSNNETFDNFKSTTNETISKLRAENAELTEKISILNEQINNLNNELNETKSSTAKEIDLRQNQIETLRSQMVETDKLKSDYDAKVALIEDSYKQQVAIASEAQSNYDKELQKHAEVSRAVSLLRQESAELKEQIQTLSSESKQAKDELIKSQESWTNQRITLEEELRVANARVQDLTSQNHILYNQIETLTKRTEESGSKDIENGDSSTDELRELISLLRREKEISDTQLDSTISDLKRVRQQLEIATTELDKNRLELAKLSQRELEATNLSEEHSKLLQEINQLNLLRESNVTLRNELSLNLAKVKELESKLNEANSKVEPLQSELVTTKAEIAHRTQEIKLITEEKERWKQRSQDILNKYDRIDPSEHESLKKQLEEANAKVQESEEKLVAEHDKLERLRVHSQKVINIKSEDRKEAQRACLEAQNSLKKLEESSKAQLEEVKKEAAERIEKLRTEIKDLKDKSSKNHQKNNGQGKTIENLNTQLKQKETELAEAKQFESKYNDVLKTNSQLDEKVTKLEKEIAGLQKELATKTGTPGSSNEEIDRLKEELNKEKVLLDSLKEELERERAELDSKKGTPVPGASADSTELLKQQEIKLREEFVKEKEAALEDLKTRVRGASQEKLNELAEARAAKVKEQLESEYKKKIETLENRLKESSSTEKVSNEDLEKTKSDSFNAGRDAALKEVSMRTKLLQSKIDKLTKERNQLQEKLNPVQDASPEAPINSPGATVPPTTPNPQTTTPSVGKVEASLPERPVSSISLKRPNEEQATGDAEKKPKSN